MKPLLPLKNYPDSFLKRLKFPKIWFPNGYGVRALTPEALGAVSSNFTIIQNEKIRKELSHPTLKNLDGIVCNGDPTKEETLQRSKSIFTTVNGPSLEECGGIYWVFDEISDITRPFSERILTLRKRYNALPENLRKIVRIVSFHTVENLQDAMNIESIISDIGYGGILMFSPESPYKFARATLADQILVRIKKDRQQ